MRLSPHTVTFSLYSESVDVSSRRREKDGNAEFILKDVGLQSALWFRFGSQIHAAYTAHSGYMEYIENFWSTSKVSMCRAEGEKKMATQNLI